MACNVPGRDDIWEGPTGILLLQSTLDTVVLK